MVRAASSNWRGGIQQVAGGSGLLIRSVLLAGSKKPEVDHPSVKTLADAHLTLEVRRAIAEIISLVACQSVDAMALLEGHGDCVRLVDEKGERLLDMRGYNQVWIEIWLEKFGSLEGLADAASRGEV